jgi:hypothetical protein
LWQLDPELPERQGGIRWPLAVNPRREWSSLLAPQSAQRHRDQAVSERQQVIAVIKDDSGVKSCAKDLAQALEAAESTLANRTRRLDFNARVPGAQLNDDVHFITVPIAEMMEGNPFRMSARLPGDLAENKSLEHLAKQFTLVIEFSSATPEQAAGKARVAEMQLGRLD